MKKSVVSKGLVASSFLIAVLSANANASDEGFFTGSFQTVIETNPKVSTSVKKPFSLESMTNTKIISLMRLSPTPEILERAERVAQMIEARDIGTSKPKADLSKKIIPFRESESAKDLTMKSVPVLDQGQYGTCVTFATTAALDATIDAGDFIDQQCALAHSLFLGHNYWEGARYAGEVIVPLQKYGVVQQGNCPEKYPNPDLKIKTSDYKKLVHKSITVEGVKYKHENYLSLDNVRDAIDKGHRIAFGFMVKASSDPISVQGYDIVINGEKRAGGFWDCRLPGSKKNYCGFAFAGHEVVIVGYDDAQELLKIRNSWGPDVGEDGDFYMSYDFFEAMGLDGTEIWEAE